MVIFHSYVKLPEGSRSEDVNEAMGQWASDRQFSALWHRIFGLECYFARLKWIYIYTICDCEDGFVASDFLSQIPTQLI